MSDITTRSGKGSPLTNTELDANFTNLNNDKVETSEVVTTAAANKLLKLNASSQLPASITGNAATATALETSRTIGGVSFDGTANIDLPGVNTAGNQNTSGNAATATTASAAPWSGITGKPTTLSGYGITDAQPASTAITTSNIGSQSVNYATSAGSATSSPLLSALGTYAWSASTTPTSFSQGIQTSFVQSANGFPNYGSVMTMNTYSGGGGALQLYVPYSPTYGGTGLQVRFGNYDVSSGNSWTSWKTLLASDNYNSYAPTLTGSGASGTWGISISGNAATASNIESTQSNLGYSVSGTSIEYSGQGGPQVRSQGGGAAMMSFHRPGAYAINFGLGTDNQLRTGGWSRGGSYVVLDSGNYSGFAIPRSESKDFGSIYINPNGSGVCTTAEFITHLTNLGFFNYARATGKCAWDYAGNNDITDTGFGQLEMAGSVIETWTTDGGAYKHVRVTRPTTGAGGFQTLVYNDQSSGYSPGWRAYITSENIGSQSVNYATSAGNADTVDSLHIHTGRNNEANKLVRTDVNGYIQAGYINSTSGNEANNSSPPRVWGTNGSDDYLRTYLTSALSVGSATNASYSYNYTQGFNSNWNTDFAEAPAGSTILRGDTSTGSSTGGPGGTWWFQQNMRHGNSSNVWGVQVAWGWEDNANILRTRNVTGGSYGGWVTYVNSANVSSYAIDASTAQTLSNKTISAGVFTGDTQLNGSTRGNVTTATTTISCNSGNYFVRTQSANSTYTFSSPPSSGVYAFTFELTLTSGTVTWPSSVRWPGDSAPALTTGKTHLLTFVTDDGGVRWRGASLTNYTT